MQERLTFLVGVDAANMALQVLATVEALPTAVDAARKGPCALAHPGHRDGCRLGRHSATPTLLGQVRNRDGDGAATQPGHANVAIAGNLDVKVHMRRRADRSYASGITGERLGRHNRGECKLDRSGRVRQRALGRSRLSVTL